MPYSLSSLLELVRHHALPYNRAPIGTPPARIEVFTARGKRVPTTTKARPAAVTRPGRRLTGDDGSHEQQKRTS